MAKNSFTPQFIVFEGLDGSGKSTLIKAVSAELERRGKGFVLTREPGGTPLAEEIRRLILRIDSEVPVAETELLLYAASRAQHVAQVIQPALAKGEWVLCDRFTASSVAFQCFARGLSRANVEWLNSFATRGLRPALSILLDLDVTESHRRQEGRSGQDRDRMERESNEFHEAVRRGYLTQVREQPAKWFVVDAALAPEKIKELVLEKLEVSGWLAS
jgi:dTMP kinase